MRRARPRHGPTSAAERADHRRARAANSDSSRAFPCAACRDPTTASANVPAQEILRKEKTTDRHPLSDLAYDWITLIQNKAQALNAYDQYIQDAEQANSPECAAFFRKVHDTDKAQLAEAKEHLVAVLQGKMGKG